VKLLGVVKANAYGHGAVPVASYLENQVDYFATATIEEAVELRENGISAPILILGYVSPSQYGDLVEYDITQTIDSYAQALALEKEAARQNRKAKAHLAVDTGMTRIGFQVTEHDADEAAKNRGSSAHRAGRYVYAFLLRRSGRQDVLFDADGKI
jgi:alr: alanine racemase